mmetsp:Transcript_45096/g.125069  ORF Transcript_45096/g.125069 Transcript_45096/m.125069 type:complete len:224 (+) Transcript_45096:21-692(+)
MLFDGVCPLYSHSSHSRQRALFPSLQRTPRVPHTDTKCTCSSLSPRSTRKPAQAAWPKRRSPKRRSPAVWTLPPLPGRRPWAHAADHRPVASRLGQASRPPAQLTRTRRGSPRARSRIAHVRSGRATRIPPPAPPRPPHHRPEIASISARCSTSVKRFSFERTVSSSARPAISPSLPWTRTVMSLPTSLPHAIHSMPITSTGWSWNLLAISCMKTGGLSLMAE